jgi:hypothetical protein
MKQTMFIGLAAIGLTLVSPPAHATGDLAWRTILIKGEGRAALCNDQTVSPVYNGDDASFVFTSLGVNIAAGSAGPGTFQEFGACQIRVRVTIPLGTYLQTLGDDVEGGVIKSAGARGAIRSSYFLRTAVSATVPDAPALPDTGSLGLLDTQTTTFAPSDETLNPLLEQFGSRDFRPAEVATECGWTRNRAVDVDLIVRVSVEGMRTRADQGVLVDVDGSDVNFAVAPRLGVCPRR